MVDTADATRLESLRKSKSIDIGISDGGIAIGNKNRFTSDAATLSLTLLRSGRSTAPKIPRKQGLIESCANWHGFRAELVFELTMFSFLVQELNFGDEKSNGFTSFNR